MEQKGIEEEDEKNYSVEESNGGSPNVIKYIIFTLWNDIICHYVKR